MAVALKFAKDAQGATAYAPKPANVMQEALLTNGNAQSFTVPSLASYYTVAFTYQPGTVCFVDATGAATEAPIAEPFASTTSALLPSSYLLAAGTVVSIVTVTATAYVGVRMYQGGND